MRLTRDVLRPPGAPQWRLACLPQFFQFNELHPGGVEPTVEVLTELAAENLDVWWLVRVLPPGVQLAYAVWCADPDGQNRHLAPARRKLAGKAVPWSKLKEAANAAGKADLYAVAAAAETAWAVDAGDVAVFAEAAAEDAVEAAVGEAWDEADAAPAVECARQLAWLSAALLDEE